MARTAQPPTRDDAPARRRTPRSRHYALKWRRIVPAAALAAWGAHLALTGARQLFDLRWGLLRGSEWWELLLPLALATLVVLAGLRRRFASLVDPPGSHPTSGCRWFCWAMIAAMLVTGQIRFSRTHMRDREIAAIDDAGTPSPYVRYRPAQFAIRPEPLCGAVDYHTVRHDVHVTISFLLPFEGTRGPYLYGVEIERKAPRRLSDEEFARQVDAYVTLALQQLRRGELKTTGYFRLPASAREQARYRKALERARYTTTSDRWDIPPERHEELIVLTAAEPPRPVRRFGGVWIAFLAGMAPLHLMLLFPRWGGTQGPGRAARTRQAGRPAARLRARSHEVWRLFMAAQPLSTVVAATLALSLGVLLFGTGSPLVKPSSDELLAWGAMRRAEVAAGGWWRPLTTILLHGSWGHLLYNCMSGAMALLCSLVLFGPGLRSGTIYLLSGLAGSLASLAVHPDSVCIGASGAIMGLLGATIVAGLRYKRGPGGLIAWAAVTAVFTFVAGAGVGVDNAAHAGGFAAGALLGLLLYPRPERRSERRPAHDRRSGS